MTSKADIVIVGAGIGGLVAALELADHGLEVVVIDRGAAPGGKLRAVDTLAGPTDAGPTVLTLPDVFEELFDEIGENLSSHLTLVPLDVLARHHWRGSPTLDLHADHERSRQAIAEFGGARAAGEFERFAARAKTLFEALDKPVLRHDAPTPFGVAVGTLGKLPSILAAAPPWKALSGYLASSFSDPRLRQLFGRYATYVGGSPYLAPSVLSLIAHVELKGVYTIKGGMHRLPKTLVKLARARGVVFRYGETVARIDAKDAQIRAVFLQDGSRLDARSVVFNGDAAALPDLLDAKAGRRVGERRALRHRSLSAWVWSFAGEPHGTKLAHHNVFFSDDYEAEFEDLTRNNRRPQDPTLYLCAQDRANSVHAAGGAERFQIIMNAPADGDSVIPTGQEIYRCETTVFNRLAEAGVMIPRPLAEGALTTAWDFNAMFPGSGGAIYGRAPKGLMTPFRRATARTPIKGLYLAGGSVHPGPGVPMAALSGRFAASAILKDRASISTSRRMATRGGMSMDSPMTANRLSRLSDS